MFKETKQKFLSTYYNYSWLICEFNPEAIAIKIIMSSQTPPPQKIRQNVLFMFS